MAELSWRDALIKVLEGSAPMHYTEIADAVLQRGLKTKVGATPSKTASMTLTESIRNEGTGSPFMKVEPGRFCLRTSLNLPTPMQQVAAVEVNPTGLINAFGMYWDRSKVDWRKSVPRLFGLQKPDSTRVDFAGQKGVYLLHDRRTVVYVGRARERALAVRLREHVSDRLSSRWDRFSWFGVHPVKETGSLDSNGVGTYDLSMLIATMEALLIEGLEPPQNRKRGDDFEAVEFLQAEDPEFQEGKVRAEFIQRLAQGTVAG